MHVFCTLLLSLVSISPQYATILENIHLGAITGAVAQRHETISGEIYFTELIGAQVYVIDSTIRVGTFTDRDGEYILRLPPGIYTIIFKTVGFADIIIENVEVVGFSILTDEKYIWKLATNIDAEMIPQAQHSYIHVTPQE